MNQKLKNRGQLHDQASPTETQNLAVIHSFLNQWDVDADLVSEFCQGLEWYKFELGDDLLSDRASSQSQNSAQSELNPSDLYLVCQGRVRLLGYNPSQKRHVSAGVLESGDSFGADTLVRDRALPYQVRAVSSGLVARMAETQLNQWVERLPQLQDHLVSTITQRQRLLFLKTTTELAETPSQDLQQLLPYLDAEHIPAGEPLIQSTPPNSGRFWLRSGEIESPGNDTPPPDIGDSWGYPQTIPEDWVAQTDLSVYRLSTDHWQTAESIAPILSLEAEDANHSGNGHIPSAAKKKAVLPVQKTRKVTPTKSPKSEPQDQSESESISFPKPKRRIRRAFWRGYPFIQQQSSSDCGAACLAMVGRYWGKRFSLPFLRNLAGVGRTGASLSALAKAADNLGFQARPVRASLSSLVEIKQPWIAHWGGNHYVLVYWCKGDRMLVADPAVGRRKISRQAFLEGWTGYALLIEPTERLKEVESQKISFGKFISALSPYRMLIGQIILASLLIQLFGLITPLFTQIILDRVVIHKSFITLHVFAIGLLLFGIWRIGIRATRQYLLDYFGNRIDLTLIGGFISHTLTLPLSFFESRHVGDIITRVQENRKLQRFLTRKAITAWLDALMAVVYIGLMAYYNWKLTLVVLAIIPPIAILTLFASPFLRRVSREIFKEDAGQNSSLVEMMNGVATVKANAAERELRWRWEDRLTRMLNARFRGQKLANGLQSTGGLFQTLGNTALLWYGATLVIQDQLTIGQFVAFNMLIGNVISPVLALVGLWDELQEVTVSVERLNDVFEAEPEESPQHPLLVLPRLQGDIKFDNVTFRYSDQQERNTLQNISLEVESGQTVALVGRSGSGKTTLVNLLQGLYHPTSGRIWVDGHDLRHASPQSLRAQLGVVPQECFLFSGTIMENITLYAEDVTLDQVVEVAKLAEAHAFIEDMPLGYHTQVGERGASLSGGQRQRIAIARALLGDPRILVLDEATSSLDTDSERRFQQNLTRISRDRTTLIIAHRLSTVRHADCIVVLDKGILVEQGNHEQLIDQGGLYYHLAQQQLDL
ncbi:MAG: ABC transporter transmembrane domain-containing protein [Coleofasciculus sp.]